MIGSAMPAAPSESFAKHYQGLGQGVSQMVATNPRPPVMAPPPSSGLPPQQHYPIVNAMAMKHEAASGRSNPTASFRQNYWQSVADTLRGPMNSVTQGTPPVPPPQAPTHSRAEILRAANEAAMKAEVASGKSHPTLSFAQNINTAPLVNAADPVAMNVTRVISGGAVTPAVWNQTR
jgi:hypothetical protein